MKKFLTTVALVTAIALPAYAEGDDASAKQGEPKAAGAKASTDAKQDAGSGAMGQGRVMQRSTTGAAPSADKSDSSPANPGSKTNVNTGGDGGSGSGGSGGGSGGSGGGSGN